MIDNYDSFTFNLVHYFCALGAKVKVVRNDAISIDEIEKMAPEHIVISPGPCTPNEAGISLELVSRFAGQIPILGVCLGHQTIAQAFGGEVVRARKVMHGKRSLIQHNQQGIFCGLNNPLDVVRYHSLVVKPGSLPAEFEVTAMTEDGEIMGIAHQQWPLWGVQFHPESILSEQGDRLLQNFLSLTK